MAPLPPETTGRLFIEYTSLGQEHVAVVRLGTTGTSLEAAAVYGALAPLIAPFLPVEDAITGARYAAPGSNLSFPLGVTPEPGTNTQTFDPDNKPEFISFTGRSLGGRRTRFTIFTPAYNPDVDGYRVLDLTGGLGALRNELATNESITAIDGEPVIWNSYANAGYNAYFQRKQRRSG